MTTKKKGKTKFLLILHNHNKKYIYQVRAAKEYLKNSGYDHYAVHWKLIQNNAEYTRYLKNKINQLIMQIKKTMAMFVCWCWK